MVPRVVAMTDELTVHIQVVVEAVVCVMVDPGDPEIPTRRDIAALLAPRCVTIEVLADERGLIACCVEFGRDRIGFMP